MQCAVTIKRLPLYEAFPTLCLATSVLVEQLPRSVVHPGRVFRSEKQPKSLYPGHIFTSHPVPNWTQCTVPVERTSISVKLPGHIFSATAKPVEHPSVSSKLPGHIFTAHSRPQMNWTSCNMPTDNVPMSVRKPGMIFCSQAMYKQKASAPVARRFETALRLMDLLLQCSCSNVAFVKHTLTKLMLR